MNMSSDVIANFVCLDELTQVIYQGAYQFIVLSTVSDRWMVHLGLVGSEARWWRGSWTKSDVLQIAGSKSSDKLLEAFAEKLAETFTGGQLHVANWSPEPGADIKLTFSPSAAKPLDIPLVELTLVEAVSYATDVLLDIALHAQARKCCLHPDSSTSNSYTPLLLGPTVNATSTDVKPAVPAHSPVATSTRQTAEAPYSNRVDRRSHEETKAPTVELERQKQRSTTSAPVKAKAATAAKGASLANPNKKARKYQAIEFESDEE